MKLWSVLNFVLVGVACAGFSDSRDITKTSQGKKSVTFCDLGTLLSWSVEKTNLGWAWEFRWKTCFSGNRVTVRVLPEVKTMAWLWPLERNQILSEEYKVEAENWSCKNHKVFIVLWQLIMIMTALLVILKKKTCPYNSGSLVFTRLYM